jgi:transposase-like protein
MEKHGRGKRRTFSAEYKAEAVRLVACNSDIGIALMYHEACVKESFS